MIGVGSCTKSKQRASQETVDKDGDVCYLKVWEEETETDACKNSAAAKKTGQLGDEDFAIFENDLANWLSESRKRSEASSSKGPLAILDGSVHETGKKKKKDDVGSIIAGGKDSKEKKKGTKKEGKEELKSGLAVAQNKGQAMVKLASDISTKCLKIAGKIKLTSVTKGMIQQLKAALRHNISHCSVYRDPCPRYRHIVVCLVVCCTYAKLKSGSPSPWHRNLSPYENLPPHGLGTLLVGIETFCFGV
jgi:hypothetical protein